MKGTVYLIRNADLYKIGRTNNLRRLLKELKPNEIVKTMVISDPKSLEARLLKRYKSVRIPDSGYFRLNETQLEDCIKQLSDESQLALTVNDEWMIGVNGSVIIFFIILTIASFIFKIGLLKSIGLSSAFSSLPMWTLFFTGSFGGYESIDLSPFSTFYNRIRAFIFGFIFSIISYLILSDFNIN